MGENLSTGRRRNDFQFTFWRIIRSCLQTDGKQVGGIIDEYDSTKLDSNHNDEVQKEIRNIMRDFFSPLKAQGQYLLLLIIDRYQQIQPNEYLQRVE